MVTSQALTLETEKVMEVQVLPGQPKISIGASSVTAAHFPRKEEDEFDSRRFHQLFMPRVLAWDWRLAVDQISSE